VISDDPVATLLTGTGAMRCIPECQFGWGYCAHIFGRNGHTPRWRPVWAWVLVLRAA